MSIRLPAGGRDSLAGRLTRTLILWVGGVWLLCVFAVVWYVDREINHNFDNELVEVSHRMFDMAVQELDKLQHGATATARRSQAEPLVAPKQLFSEDAVIYQIVDLHEHVLLRSAETPADTFDVPLAAGFANNPTWRIYTVRHPTLGLYFQVADPLDERRRALNRTLFGLIIPLGAVLPLLALVLRNVARTELRVLQQLSGEIEKRSGADLSPIALPGLPRELRTVGDHVNRLLERLSQSLDVERALAANAAHELRTPLAAARLRLQTALEHDLRRNDVQAALDALADAQPPRREAAAAVARGVGRVAGARAGRPGAAWWARWRRSSGKTPSSASAWRSRCPTSPRPLLGVLARRRRRAGHRACATWWKTPALRRRRARGDGSDGALHAGRARLRRRRERRAAAHAAAAPRAPQLGPRGLRAGPVDRGDHRGEAQREAGAVVAARGGGARVRGACCRRPERAAGPSAAVAPRGRPHPLSPSFLLSPLRAFLRRHEVIAVVEAELPRAVHGRHLLHEVLAHRLRQREVVAVGRRCCARRPGAR
jgi:hypothetical protein